MQYTPLKRRFIHRSDDGGLAHLLNVGLLQSDYKAVNLNMPTA
jgi:hypothetical protein